MKKRFIYDKFKSKDGSALLMTVVVFLVIVIISMGSSMVALANLNRSKTSSEYTSVYYVAEAGLNQFIDELKQFVKANEASISNDPQNLGNKFASNMNSGDDNIIYDYNSLMQEKSYATVKMDFLKFENGVYTYNINSVGNVGDVSRTVNSRLELSISQSEDKRKPIIGIDSPAIISYNNSEVYGEIGMSFSGWRDRVTGPFITNKSISRSSVYQKWYGPFITGGDFTNGGGLTSYNPIIVHGDLKNTNSGNSKMSILMLVNPESKIDIAGNSLTIDYLYVPKGFDIRNITVDSIRYGWVKVSSDAEYETEISKSVKNIVFYEPLNFDPYSYEGYISNRPSNATINMLFENEGIYPYKNYFSSNFLLNLEEKDVKELLPEYTMPSFPTMGTSTHPWASNTTVSKDSNANNIVINNDLISTNSSGSVNNLYFKDNFSVKKISINSGGAINRIFIGNKNIEVLVESLDITNSNIEIIGSGSLTIKVVGQNGYVNSFLFQPNYVKMMETENGPTIQDPSRFRIIVNKSDKGNGPLTYNTNNSGGANVPLNAVIIADDLNLVLQRNFHGVFISLNGNSAHITSSGETYFSGLLYMPKAKAKIENGFLGSLVTATFDMTSSGFTALEYAGSMNDEMINDVLAFLDYKNSGQNGNNGNNGNSGNNESGGSNSGGNKSFNFVTSPPREIGD